MERSKTSLARSAGVEHDLELNPVTEIAWIEVIQKMESVYADLVNTQVEVENKNTALEEAQRFIRSVLTSMTDVLVVSDLQGRILQVNKAVEDLTGKREAELLGRSLSSLLADGSGASPEFLLELQDSESVADQEVSLIDKNGEPVPLAINCSSHYDADGRLVGMVLIGRLVGELQRAYRELNKAHEELKQAEMQLIHSEKMASLGRLVAGVAHELNNPISFVFGNMRALQKYGDRISRYLTAIDEKRDPESLQRLRDELKIDRIMNDMNSLIGGTLEGAERVRDIVQDLRRYSTSQKEQVCPFDLTEQVRTAVKWVTKACRTKPDVSYDMPESLPVHGRKGHVQQILVNLLQNAADVMDGQKNPRIDIVVTAREQFAEVAVRDFGPGIPEAALRKLFDPFFTTKPVGEGTGLGLSISYGLATNLGGSLTAENHAEGGAVFLLSVPLEGDPDE